jgi:hypothetical protein
MTAHSKLIRYDNIKRMYLRLPLNFSLLLILYVNYVFPLVFDAPEDTQLRPKHAGLQDYIIIKQIDTTDGYFKLILMKVVYRQ